MSTRALVHIGMHKTASSSLQGMWGAMDQVALSKAYCLETAAHLFDVVASGGSKPFALPETTPLYASPAKIDDPYRVYSAENISNPSLWSFDREHITLYHQLAAEIFQKLAGEGAKVLLVVREPESWLTSLYKQEIQAGSAMTFQRFLLSAEDCLSYLLSLEFLEHWEARFGAENVVVLPYELIRQDMDGFFDTLVSRLGLPEKSFTADPRVNVSVSTGDAAFLRQASRIMKLFVDNASLAPETKAQFQKNAAIISEIMRSEIQNKPDGRVARLARKLQASEATDAVVWPASFRTSLQEGMLPRLQSRPGDFEDVLPQYAAAFSAT